MQWLVDYVYTFRNFVNVYQQKTLPFTRVIVSLLLPRGESHLPLHFCPSEWRRLCWIKIANHFSSPWRKSRSHHCCCCQRHRPKTFHHTIIFDLMTLTLKFDLLFKNFNLGHNLWTVRDSTQYSLWQDLSNHTVIFYLVTLTFNFYSYPLNVAF